jgi:hypothetical protein
MILVAGGDSFVLGSELHDQTGYAHSNLTVPALLSEQFALDYVCTAVSGNSNSAIARMVMNECERHTDKAVFVMWSFAQRFEFRFNYYTGRRTSPWHSVTSWDIVDNFSDITKHFNKHDDSISNSMARHNTVINKNGIADFSKTFYKHVGDSESFEWYTTLKEIVFLQNYLKLNKIPYMFSCADAHPKYALTENMFNEEPSLRTLYDQIDWASWYEFPASTQHGDTTVPRGFYQWAVENKYPVGVTHPLETAHSDAAELMKDTFNELVIKHLQPNQTRDSVS